MTHTLPPVPAPASVTTHAKVGAFTDADIAAFMPEARRQFLHTTTAAETIPLDYQEWAIQRMAFNLFCESRGYDVREATAARDRQLQREREVHAARAMCGRSLAIPDLAPMRRAGGYE